MEVINEVTEILSSIIDTKEFEIVNITYKREGRTMVLRILLDKEDGISIGECSKINNKLSENLDKENVIDEYYILEVSSPGLDRSMKTDRDFERVMGKDIKVTTYAPIDGKNVFIGKLQGLSALTIVVEGIDGISTEVSRDKIAKAKLEIKF